MRSERKRKSSPFGTNKWYDLEYDKDLIAQSITTLSGDVLDITDLIVDVDCESRCMSDSDRFGIGGMYVGSLNCELNVPYSMKDELIDAEIVIESGVTLASGEIEWIPMGKWFVSSGTRSTGDRLRLTCNDALIKLFVDTKPHEKAFVGVVDVKMIMAHVTDLTGVEFAQTYAEINAMYMYDLYSFGFAAHYGNTAWEEVQGIYGAFTLAKCIVSGVISNYSSLYTASYSGSNWRNRFISCSFNIAFSGKSSLGAAYRGDSTVSSERWALFEFCKIKISGKSQSVSYRDNVFVANYCYITGSCHSNLSFGCTATVFDIVVAEGQSVSYHGSSWGGHVCETSVINIDIELVNKLEKLYAALNCSKIIVNSGYRCSAHDKAVGGNGSGQHTKGTAADIVCYGADGKVISSKKVTCAAQDLGFGGVANINSSYTATHVDVRTGSVYRGDETRGTNSVTSDFYAYWKLSKADVYGSAVKRTKDVTIIFDGVTYKGTLTEI